MTTTTAAPRRAARVPSTLSIGARRAALETKQMLRQRESLIFTFAFPVVILVLFGAIFSDRIPGTEVDFRQYFIAGMIATGIMAATFVNLGIAIAIERDDGTLKHLRGTPMRVGAYFIGKVAMVLVVTLIQVAVLIAFSVIAFGLPLPSTPDRWLTFAWVLLLGVAACTMLGIAISAVPRTSRSASGIVVLPFMVLQFVSGVFFVFSQMPEAMQQFGALFPLKWIGQGLRSVFLPDSLQSIEPAGTWEHGTTALVLCAWIVVCLVLSVTTFRWQRSRG
ncbi:ABC transporter permease [Amycolatopsis magusensis]|uniref:Transport permease protein n=1 Tax=Amycolatopsis magusensis TaxID=882444 RepID=A0ABS4PXS6_9PSEU|nr:ABC transporter permease [Amycolatopsis magusensis]MBP2184233.1 ABC-2 type transport system permease protein [Amycolatopsis magusensis]MDI5982458.1 ABC transporter permease [Amycolatopsis magusensis]